MTSNISSGDFIVERSISYSKIASSNDKAQAQLRHNVDLKDSGQAKRDYEINLRETANLEIGRSRNISKII